MTWGELTALVTWRYLFWQPASENISHNVLAQLRSMDRGLVDLDAYQQTSFGKIRDIFFSPSFARRLLVKRLGRNTTSYSRSQNITKSRSVVDSDKTGGWMKTKMAYRHDSYAKWWALETESSRYALLTLNYNHTKWNFRSPPWGCGISTFVPFWLGFDELCLSVCLSLSSTNSTTHQSLEKITKILFSHESSILMICETRWKVSSLCRS